MTTKTTDELVEIARRLERVAPPYGVSLTPEYERRLNAIVEPLAKEDLQRLYAVWVLTHAPKYTVEVWRR